MRRVISHYPDGKIPEQEFEVVERIINYGFFQNNESYIDGSFLVRYSKLDYEYIKTEILPKLLEILKLLK